MGYVEDYVGDKEAVKEAMKSNLEAFSRAKLDSLKKVVGYVEEYIGEEAVKEAMKSNLQGFSDCQARLS